MFVPKPVFIVRAKVPELYIPILYWPFTLVVPIVSAVMVLLVPVNIILEFLNDTDDPAIVNVPAENVAVFAVVGIFTSEVVVVAVTVDTEIPVQVRILVDGTYDNGVVVLSINN